MVLGIGAERYAVELRDVEEVLPPVRATPVPGAAAVFAGVINVHGEIRPVMDLRRLLGMDAVRQWRSAASDRPVQRGTPDGPADRQRGANPLDRFPGPANRTGIRADPDISRDQRKTF